MDNQGPNNYNYNNGPGNNGSGGNGNNGGNRPGGNGGRNNRGGQGIMAFILLTLVALFVYALISNSISHASTQEKSYSDFIKQLDKGNVKSVEFDSYEIDYKLVDDGHKDYDITYYTGRVADDELVPTLKKAKTSEGKSIEIKAAIPDNTSTWIFNILSFIVPLILLWVLLAFVSKKMGGSMGMGVGKSTAKVYVEKSTGVNFKDVAALPFSSSYPLTEGIITAEEEAALKPLTASLAEKLSALEKSDTKAVPMSSLLPLTPSPASGSDGDNSLSSSVLRFKYWTNSFIPQQDSAL